MIFSLTTFFNEVDLLKIRLEIMKPLYPIHIVVESPYTHSGDKKPLFLGNMFGKDEDTDWMNFDYRVFNKGPYSDPWDAEKGQRNWAAIALKNYEPEDHDIIIITDLDEIVNPDAVWRFMESGQEVASLRMNHYSYYINVLQGWQSWNVGRICTWKYLKDKTPSQVRNEPAPYEIDNAGNHFSWLGGVDKIITKMWSYAHTETINEFTTDPDNIKRKLEENQSLWTERPDDLWRVVPIDDKFPKYIRDNEDELTLRGYIKTYK